MCATGILGGAKVSTDSVHGVSPSIIKSITHLGVFLNPNMSIIIENNSPSWSFDALKHVSQLVTFPSQVFKWAKSWKKRAHEKYEEK